MSAISNIPTPLVSVQWLREHLDASNLIVLDATMPIVTAKKGEQFNKKTQIVGARFIDIKKVFSEVSAPFPNTMLSAEKFTNAAKQLGINNESFIVVYDAVGVYSSPRIWWMFKAMGHSNIAVLDGGLPEWIRANYPTENVYHSQGSTGNFKAQLNIKAFANYHEVLDSIATNDHLVIDARSEDRFMGLIDEPRQGLRSGHIPKSKNIPYSKVLDGGKMKSKDDLKAIFKELTKATRASLIFSCGSGITACILALAAEEVGFTKKSVYDGSWTEWGSLSELPIEK